MANDKKFIVKNGLLTPGSGIFGKDTDDSTGVLQVEGNTTANGTITIDQGTAATPTLLVKNTGGYAFADSVIAKFLGDSDGLEIRNFGQGDYAIYNSQQDNGIEFYDGTAGIKIRYNDTDKIVVDSFGIDLKDRLNVFAGGYRVLTEADEGSGNGLDADSVDGLEASQFLRSDVADVSAPSDGSARVAIGHDSGGSLSLGRTDSTASNPYIDFNSGGTTVDYDSRISATGGDGTVGNGTITVTSGTINLNADTLEQNGYTIWTGFNDGAGSGLDADLLDGLDSLQFVRADQNDTMDGDYIITGNLTVQGTTTTVNSEQVLIADNILTLNSNFTSGTPTENAGWEVLRGDQANSSLQWDETNDYFKLISAGTDLGRIITTADEGSGNGFDADTVDGLEAWQFLRTDVDDVANGDITFNSTITVNDGSGGASIYLNGSGTLRTLYSNSGEVGFLNASLNYAAKSDANDNWIVTANTEAVNVIASNDITATSNITATTGNITATAGAVSAGTTVTAGTDVIGQRFVDADNNSYLVNPADESVLHALGIDDDLYHNGDTDTKLNFTTATIKLDTDGTTRLTANNTGVHVDSLSGSTGTFTTSVSAPIYYDSDAPLSYWGDFSGTSNMSRIDIDDYIRHRGDTNTYIGFDAADSFGVWTAGTNRLRVDPQGNVGVGTSGASVSYRLDVNTGTSDWVRFASTDDKMGIILNDNDTTNYIITKDNYLSLGTGADISRSNLNIANSGNVGIGTTTPTEAMLVVSTAAAATANPTTAGNQVLSLQDNETTKTTVALDSFGNNWFISESDSNFVFANSAATVAVSIDTETADVIINDSSVTYTISDATPVVGSITNNKLHVNGSIQLFGNNDAIVFGRGTSSFLKDEELGFGWGSGWYQTDATYLRVRNNTTVYSTGDADFARFRDSNNTSFYADFANTGLSINFAGQARGGNGSLTSPTYSFGSDTNTGMYRYAADVIGFSAGGNDELRVYGTYVDAVNQLRTHQLVDRENTNYILEPQGVANGWRLSTPSGYLDFGPLNTTYSHFQTDRSKFYFNKFTEFDGGGAGAYSGDDYAYFPIYYDWNDNNYYGDFAGTSRLANLNLVGNGGDAVLRFGPGIPANDDAHIEWKGGSNSGYLRFSTSDDNGTEYMEFGDYDNTNRGGTFTRWSLLNRDYLSHTSDMRAPIFYDLDDTNWYADPNSTSALNKIWLGRNPTLQSVTGNLGQFGSVQTTGGATGGWEGFSINGRMVFMHDNNNAVGIFNDVDNEWMLLGERSSYMRLYTGTNWEIGSNSGYAEARLQMRAPIYYDSDNLSYYTDQASTSVHNIQRVNQLQVDGSTYIVDSPTGDYGTIKVEGAKGGTWAGYAIRDDWVFMSDGANSSGIYNDTDNEWSIRGFRNSRTDIFANGQWELRTDTNRADTRVAHYSPIYYDGDDASWYGDFASQSKMRDVAVGDQGILASGYPLTVYDGQRYLLGLRNSTADANYPWLVHDTRNNNSTMILHFNGIGDRFWFEENGNFQAYGAGIFGTLALNGGNEDLGLLKTYGAGHSEPKMFDGNEYWDKRVIQPMQGVENNATTNTAEYVKTTDAPGSSGYVLRTSDYRTFDSDYIPVEAGEEIYGEISARYISGSGRLLYMGVRRYDKDKKPIASNDGITYFVANAVNVTSTGWTTYRGHHTLPTTHTPYNGSDGGACRYVRVIVLMNYNGSGALREFTAPILRRTNNQSRLRTDYEIYASRYYDSNDNNFYVDPASTSIMNRIDASVMYDRDNTGFVVDPNGNSNFVRADFDEINIDGGTRNNTNDATLYVTASGNQDWGIIVNKNRGSATEYGLDIRMGATHTYGMRMLANNAERWRLNTSYADHWGEMRSSLFRDRNDTNYYVDPASESRINSLRTAGRVVIGGTFQNNAYSSVNSTRLHFGGGDSDANGNYYIGTNKENYGGNYTKLDLRWHTGIRMGAQAVYGGVRIYDSEDLGTVRFSVNKGDANTRVESGSFYSNIMYDRDNVAYYCDPASTSVFNALTLGGYSQNNPMQGQWYQRTAYNWNGSQLQYYYIKVANLTNNSSIGAIEYYAKRDSNYPGAIRGTVHMATYAGSSMSIQHDQHGSNGQMSAEVYIDNNRDVYLRFPGCAWNSHVRWRWIYRSGQTIKDEQGGLTQPANSRLIIAGKSYRMAWNDQGNLTHDYDSPNIANRYDAHNSVRAPVFYDSDNTTYNGNFAGTSRMNEIDVNQVDFLTGGQARFYTAAGNLRGYIQATDDNDAHFKFATSSGEDIRFMDNGLNGDWNMIIRGDGDTLVNRYIYAQRFYDRNDGNYYADPASTSRFNALHLNGGSTQLNFSNGWYMGSVDTDDFMIRSGDADHGRLNFEDSGGTDCGELYWDDDGSVFLMAHDNGENIIYGDQDSYTYLYYNGTWEERMDAGYARARQEYRAPLFRDVNDTGYYTEQGSTSYHNRQRVRNLYDSSEQRFVNPEGAYFRARSSRYTGYVKINLPTDRRGRDTMLSFTVNIYEYGSGRLHQLRIGGYNYRGTDNYWANAYAYQISAENTSPYTIRFCDDGNDPAITIGESNSVWYYPQIWITDLQTGYYGQSVNWGTDWGISITTTLPTVRTTYTASMALTTGNQFQWTTSMYASRYYDRDNTSYYTDPASTSRMNALLINFLEFDNGFDIYDDDSNTMSIRSNNSDNGEIYFRDSNSTACGRLYWDDDGSVFAMTHDNGESIIYGDEDSYTYTYYNGSWQERTDANYMRARYSYRAPIFYDLDNTGYYTNQAGTSYHNYQRVRNLYSVDERRFLIPEGGSYNTSSSRVTGSLAIYLPTSRRGGYTMLNFKVRVYEYNTDRMHEFHIGGYAYATGNWTNVSCTQTSSGDRGAFTIRFADNGSRHMVCIGDTGYVWEYPQVTVTDLHTGYSYFTTGWGTGWAVGFRSDYGTVRTTYTASLAYTTRNKTNWNDDHYGYTYYADESTLYYLDPNGRSRLSSVTFDGGAEINFGNSWRFRSGDSDDFYIRSGDSDHGRLNFEDSGGTDCGELYWDDDGSVFAMRHDNGEEIVWSDQDAQTYIYYNNQWQGIAQSGYWQMRQGRAEIFYDSNDTDYFLNPGDRTRSGRLRGHLQIGRDDNFAYWLDLVSASNGYARIQSWGYYGDPVIVFSDASNNASQDQVFYVGADDRDTGSFVIRFDQGDPDTPDNSGTGGGGDWTAVGSEIFQLRYDGNLSLGAGEADTYKLEVGGTVRASSWMQADYFRDDDDTAYYANPAGRSIMNSVTFNGGEEIRFGNSWHLRSGDSDDFYIRSGDSDHGRLNFEDSGGTDCGELYWDDDGSVFAMRHDNGENIIYSDEDSNTYIYYNNEWQLLTYNGYARARQMRADIFYSEGSTSYWTDPKDDSYLNTLKVRNLHNYNNKAFVNPSGASYTTTTSRVTGAIKIRLPQSRSGGSTMLSFKVTIREHGTGEITQMFIGGYNYRGTDNYWNTQQAIQLTDYSSKGALNVAWGDDGDRAFVAIGNENHVWKWPTVHITEVQTGYSGFSADWGTDWLISFTQNIPTIRQSRTASLVVTSNNAAQYNSNLYANIYYDKNNTNMRVDPSGTSYMNQIRLDEYMYHNGDTNTYLRFRTDDLQLVAGGRQMIRMDEGNDPDRLYFCEGNSYTDSSGNAVFAGNVTAYSDKKLKENVETIGGALDKITSMRGVYYNMIEDEDKTRQIGVIAQEVEEVLPEVVKEIEFKIDDRENVKTVDYARLTAVLVEGMKEQQEQINKQQEEIAELKEMVKVLLNKN